MLRQLEIFDKIPRTEKEELARSISMLRSQRPRWYPARSIAARHAQLSGDSQQALLEYRRAVELGDRRPQTLEQLISLLYQNNRLKEAEQYISLLAVEQPHSLLRDSLAIQLELKRNRLVEALNVAREAVQRHPQDPMRRIWLANLTLQSNQPQEAMQILQQTAERFPNNSHVLKGLFALYAHTQRLEEARDTIKQLLASDTLPEGSRLFIAAQSYELLGDLDEASRHYQLALKLDPTDIAIRLRYAKLLLTTDAVSAREHYERVLHLDPDQNEARRELAGILAASGGVEDWNRAQQLLRQQDTDSIVDSTTNDRIQATLLSRRGRNSKQRRKNLQDARAILNATVGGDIDRRLLANLYEQEAAISGEASLLYAAREQFLDLVDRRKSTPHKFGPLY